MVTTRTANQGAEKHRCPEWKEILDLSRMTRGVFDRKLHSGRRRLIKTVYKVRGPSVISQSLSLSVLLSYSKSYSVAQFLSC